MSVRDAAIMPPVQDSAVASIFPAAPIGAKHGNGQRSGAVLRQAAA